MPSVIFVAARGSALPMVIPVIIMGGILTGWFTPTEAGMVAAAYIHDVAFTVFFPHVVLWLPTFFLPQSVGCFPSPTGAGYICPP